jgi:hypothetical protein
MALWSNYCVKLPNQFTDFIKEALNVLVFNYLLNKVLQ